MSSSRRAAAAALLLLAVAAAHASGDSGAICPAPRADTRLRFVDVFDGPPPDLAILVPDVANDRSGHWILGYIYDAGRSVTVRCKYSDGGATDVELARRVERCDYRVDAHGTLSLRCR